MDVEIVSLFGHPPMRCKAVSGYPYFALPLSGAQCFLLTQGSFTAREILSQREKQRNLLPEMPRGEGALPVIGYRPGVEKKLYFS